MKPPRVTTYTCRIRIPIATLFPWHGIITPDMYAGRLIALCVEGRDLFLTFQRRLPWWQRIFHRPVRVGRV